ncbi:MAG TPA: hypothetical protein VNM14_25265 [Planctomycetota bacterium]|nr:hypothetical protein [Planctomycetota bacterium]
MRQLVLAVAVSFVLFGCDNKSESGSKPPADGGKSGEVANKPAESGKPAEGAKVAKHPWGSFKKGSFVKSKTTNEMEVGGNKMKTESTTTQTLKDLTADEAIIETEMVIANVPPTKTEMKLPLKAPEGTKVGDAPKPKTGSEEIEVAGKKMKCDWTETETEINGAKTVTRVYQNHDIPGFTAKMTVKSPTMSMTQEVVEYASK